MSAKRPGNATARAASMWGRVNLCFSLNVLPRRACEFVGPEPGRAWTVEQEEKFARAGEKYLLEGAVPSAALEVVLTSLMASGNIGECGGLSSGR